MYRSLQQWSMGIIQIIGLILLGLGMSVVRAEDPNESDIVESMFDLSIEELMDVEIISADKNQTRWFDSAASVSVLTDEDIHRAGVRTIPDALRLVPGVQVAQINGNTWAISIRGFNKEYSNKLLVMIDGRSVYNPLHAGVNWNQQNVVLEDIARIEVVRGPGGTLWGANAVNGVINILTKKAQDTQGTLVSMGAGTHERGFGTVRYGGRLPRNTYFRTYAMGSSRAENEAVVGSGSNDAWKQYQIGFRVDAEPGDQDLWTVQGDLSHGSIGRMVPVPTLSPPSNNFVMDDYCTTGANFLGRWRRRYDNDTDTTVQLYYDRTDLRPMLLQEERDTVDIDLQHNFVIQNHHFSVGGGYRFYRDQTTPSSFLEMDPASRDVGLYNAFIQDKMTLVPDRLQLILGIKIEHNDFTGCEYQPGGRLAWTLSSRQMTWASISRAVRSPSRYDHDAIGTWSVLPTSPVPTAMKVFATDSFDSERLLAYEWGYRINVSDALLLDLSTFYNDYDRLASHESGTPYFQGTPTGHMVIPIHFRNNIYGHTYGGELTTVWSPYKAWTLITGYSFLYVDLETRDGSQDQTTVQNKEGTSPRHQATLQSRYRPYQNLDLDVTLGYVDALTTGSIPSYLRCDFRLGWRIQPQLELNLVGQNLFEPRHQEFSDVSHRVSYAERGFYLNLQYTF